LSFFYILGNRASLQE